MRITCSIETRTLELSRAASSCDGRDEGLDEGRVSADTCDISGLASRDLAKCSDGGSELRGQSVQLDNATGDVVIHSTYSAGGESTQLSLCKRGSQSGDEDDLGELHVCER